MTFFQNMAQQFHGGQIWDFFIRLLVASVCGACIGFERSRRFKEAGVRTHVIVACASALIMIVSKYGFMDLGNLSAPMSDAVRGTDPSRIAAQVVTGVGFLGAGTIFHQKNLTRGLTTAAGIWATAGIGLAIGAGMFRIGLMATGLIMLALLVIHFFTYGINSYENSQLVFLVDDQTAFDASLEELRKENDGRIRGCNITRNEDGVRYEIDMLCRNEITAEKLSAFIESHGEIKSGSVRYL